MSDPLKRAVIFGARRDGSAAVVLDIITLAGLYQVVGFLDDDRTLWGGQVGDLPVIGGGEAMPGLRAQGVDGLAVAVGDNRARERVVGQAQRAGLTPINAIHPRAVVAGAVQLGVGIWIAAGAVVNPGTVIGDGAVLNTGSTVDHDCRIGAYANVSPGCHLSGRTVIGRYAFLGTGVITLPDARIGDDAIVGAGAVVLAAVAPGTTVVGVPARFVRRHENG
ncbi:MAG: NeuD/PglB/VioB family sugar acetyltransferase [Acidobacteriota bacterium]